MPVDVSAVVLAVWDDTATEAIIHAADDEAWRVREMAGKGWNFEGNVMCSLP